MSIDPIRAYLASREAGPHVIEGGPVGSSKDEVTAFDSTGLAIQDRAIVLAATEHAGRLDLQKLAL